MQLDAEPRSYYLRPSFLGTMMVTVTLVGVLAGVVRVLWPRRTRFEVVHLRWNNAFTYQPLPSEPGEVATLGPAEVDSVKATARTWFQFAYQGLAVSLADSGGTPPGDAHRLFVEDDCCGGEAGETAGAFTSEVSYLSVVSGARRYGPTTDREGMLTAIGRGLAVIIAHEVSHQFIGGGDNKNKPGTYDYYMPLQTSEAFYGILRWSEEARGALHHQLGW